MTREKWLMQSVHINPAEAVQAHLDLEASESVRLAAHRADPESSVPLDEMKRRLRSQS